MRLKITGKNITLTEGIKSAVKDKIKKIEKLVGDDAAVDVMLSAKHGKAKGQRAEITIKTKSSVVRAEVTEKMMLLLRKSLKSEQMRLMSLK